MLLAIDIGNSFIKAGVFDDGLKIKGMPSQPPRTPDEYRGFIEGLFGEAGMDNTPSAVVISSVVPELTSTVGNAARELSGREPLVVGPGRTGGLKLAVHSPDSLGADRIASSVAASELLGPPVVVLDFGTATTVNIIGLDGAAAVYRGGAILPGVGIMLRALAETAQLPQVAPGRAASPLGMDTEESILAGVLYGSAGAVEKIIREVEEKEGQTYRVAVTGGFMEYVLPHIEKIDLAEPALVMRGLKMIYEREEQCMS